jgi:hypothetical protein
MKTYRENVHQPVFLDIFMDSVLLERWYITYTHGMQSSPSHSSEDIITQLRKVHQRIGILLRALYTLSRILPAFPVGQQLKCQEEDLGHPLVGLHFAIGSAEAQMALQFDSAETKQRYSFVPIDTPFGMLQLSVLYRKRNIDLLQKIRSMSPPLKNDRYLCGDDDDDVDDGSNDDLPPPAVMNIEHTIIQDYVPQKEKVKASSRPPPPLPPPPPSSDRETQRVREGDKGILKGLYIYKKDRLYLSSCRRINPNDDTASTTPTERIHD